MSVDDLSVTVTDVVAAAELRGLHPIAVAADGLAMSQISIDTTQTTIETFLDLATTHGGGMLYVAVEPSPMTWLRVLENEPDHPHAGQPGSVQAAFLAGGAAHVWEQKATWYDDEFLDGLEDALVGDDAADPDDPNGERVQELAEQMLSHRVFRAARGEHRRIGWPLIPEGTEPLLASMALHEAMLMAQQRGAAAHVQLRKNYPELARTLATSPEWTTTASAAGRRQLTVAFLTEAADGYSPSAADRDELYAQARKVDAAGRRAPQLF